MESREGNFIYGTLDAAPAVTSVCAYAVRAVRMKSLTEGSMKVKVKSQSSKTPERA